MVRQERPHLMVRQERPRFCQQGRGSTEDLVCSVVCQYTSNSPRS